jgi:hypothetical protein
MNKVETSWSLWPHNAHSDIKTIYNDLLSFLVIIMDRPKRPPPVPKFEDKRDKTELEAKLNSFMNSINQAQSEISSQPIKTETPPIPKVENKL